MAVIFLEAVRVSDDVAAFVIFNVSPVPPNLGFSRNAEATATPKLNRDFKRLHYFWENFILALFWVLDKNRVMNLEKNLTDVKAPDVEHSLIDLVGGEGLWLEGDRLAESGVVGAAPEELAAPAK